MDLVKTKIEGFANVLAISLLDNHFHYCIYIKSKDEILTKLKRLRKSDLNKSMLDFLADDQSEKVFHDLITRRFSGVFNSYAQAFNKEYSRLGNLFYKPYKHSILRDKDHIKSIVYYIHHNARKHNLVKNFLDHEWNSFHLIIANDNTYIDIESVMELYSGLLNFKKQHSLFLLDKDMEMK
jgi:REP element-mobilizing transposase RayT